MMLGKRIALSDMQSVVCGSEYVVCNKCMWYEISLSLCYTVCSIVLCSMKYVV